jgi:hypothetical protein
LKDVKNVWTSERQHALQTVKRKLVTSPILKYPDLSRSFIPTTDTGNEGVGVVLSEWEIGTHLPVANASRTLNKAQRNYSITEELLAVVWGVKHCRPYLSGRKFTAVTDHKTLAWIMSAKDLGSQLLKRRPKLEDHGYEIPYERRAKYKRGCVKPYL